MLKRFVSPTLVALLAVSGAQATTILRPMLTTLLRDAEAIHQVRIERGECASAGCDGVIHYRSVCMQPSDFSCAGSKVFDSPDRLKVGGQYLVVSYASTDRVLLLDLVPNKTLKEWVVLVDGGYVPVGVEVRKEDGIGTCYCSFYRLVDLKNLFESTRG